MDVVWNLANSAKKDEEIVLLAMLEFMKIWEANYPKPDVVEQQSFVEVEDDKYPKTPRRTMEMLKYYLIKKREWLSKLTIIGIELPFIVPLGDNTDSNVLYVGRKDKVYRDPLLGGKVCVADHKTTNSGKSQWMNTFSPNDQVDGYYYDGLVTYGPDEFWGVVIDGALAQKGNAKALFEPDLPPGIGFPIIRLQRSKELIESWLWDVQYIIEEIKAQEQMLAEDCKPTDSFMKAFPHRKTACGYYSGCIYRQVCNFYANPMSLDVPLGFKVDEWKPFEILDVTKSAAEGEGGD
jgi:hypothetical protein